VLWYSSARFESGSSSPQFSPRGAESFQTDLILAGSFIGLTQTTLNWILSLPILQREFVADLQYVANCAQASTVGSYVQSMRQFIYGIVGRVFP